MSLSVQQIEAKLSRYLPPATAAQRAAWIVEDMEAVGFDLQFSTETPDGLWERLGALPQAEYILHDSEFNIDSADTNTALSGSFLTVGNLLRLSQVSAIGRELIPNLWPLQFRHRICGREHLDALTEVWWLKHWRGLHGVAPGPKQNKIVPDYEWALTIKDGLADCRINLEVKRRPGNINSWFKRRRPSAWLRSVAHKFGPTPDDTANVVALTVYAPPPDIVKRGVSEWLEQHPNVHGVVIWIEGNFGVDPLLRLFKPSRRWAEQLIRVVDPEDLKVALYCKGTLCSAEDTPAYLAALSEGRTWHKHLG